jgi:hypothetical protein
MKGFFETSEAITEAKDLGNDSELRDENFPNWRKVKLRTKLNSLF